MAGTPDILVSIVHIEGPLKGEIQELTESEIRIGRNPDCQVQFPRDLLIVSRDHARIVREGNRFKLLNKSANFTYLNGKPVAEDEAAYLKSGDWLMFAEGGPKVSFLTKVTEASQRSKKPSEDHASPRNRPAERPAAQPAPSVAPQQPSSQPPPPQQSLTQQVTLLIRYGPTLQRFKSLPITIGKSAECHFKIDHAALSNKHAEVFFRDGQYWVRDLTGTQSVFIDGRAIASEAPLMPDNKLSMTHQGPTFRFLGDGRLDEVKE